MPRKSSSKQGESFNNAWKASAEIIRDLVILFLLEFRLASKSLLVITVLGFLAFIFLLTIWLGISYGLLTWLLTKGYHFMTCFLMIVGLNLLLLLISVKLILSRIKYISFRETRREVKLLIGDRYE